MCGLRRKFALSTISHLQFEGRKCAVPLLSHLQHKDKAVQCEEKLCSTRIATSDDSSSTGCVAWGKSAL